MSENLYVGTHKHSTAEFRDGYDRIFKKKGRDEGYHTGEQDKICRECIARVDGKCTIDNATRRKTKG